MGERFSGFLFKFGLISAWSLDGFKFYDDGIILVDVGRGEDFGVWTGCLESKWFQLQWDNSH